MASIVSDPNGRKRLLFAAGDGSRKAIRLGKATMKQATAFKAKLEGLIAQTITGVADDEVNRWLAGLDDTMYARLAAVGLVKPRAGRQETLGALTDNYIRGRTDIKPWTEINLRRAEKCLIAFFGADKLLRDITEADADDYWRHLLYKGFAVNTARRLAGRAKQFFRYAVRKRWLASNPFAELKTTFTESQERQHFVDCDTAGKVLEACPDAEWRLIFALCRYAGLRCPSEILLLRWREVFWDRDRFIVHSPKTEHHSGKASRIVPIFPELYPYLRDAFELAEAGAEYVITKTRDSGVNLRTQLLRIIAKAGVEPWPKLFQNLRSTRQTELEERFPTHVVCAWLGNSPTVARKHYLQVTEAHYEQAAQNAAQSAAELACQRATATPATDENTPEFPMLSLAGSSGHKGGVPPEGLEPSTL